MRAPRLTLSLVFWGMGPLVVVLLVGLFFYLKQQSAESISIGAHRQGETAIARVEAAVNDYLGATRKTLESLEGSFASGACPLSDHRAVESCLLGTLASDPQLDAVTFTRAHRVGFDEDDARGAPVLEGERWQLQVYRVKPAADSPLCSRWVEADQELYKAKTACRDSQKLLLPPVASGEVETVTDPTDHFGFSTPASKAFDGQTLSSDLAWSQADEALPANQKRIIVTSLKAIHGKDGELLGVLKVGRNAQQLSQTIQATKVNPETDDPYRVFLCDADGKLITGFGANDVPVEDDDENLRVDPACAPTYVQTAVGSGLLGVLSDIPAIDGTVEHEGKPYLVSFRTLPQTQGWIIGVVGPEQFYHGKLDAQRTAMLAATLVILGLVIVAGGLSLRAIRGALRAIVQETERMQRFDFNRGATSSGFADVRDALLSLERAKTAVRAMGRYVPLELVRRLFRENQEPSPGGSLREVTLMFTDIEGFTSLVENESPDKVALWLGQYLSVMTAAVHATGGTVDKFIGDAVMAVWNAPTDDENHVEHACRAALECIAKTQALFASPAWEGRPPLVTRYGLHVTKAMVGNFGAPERLSYTAIGDGVNLASRLEGLNKEYGTRVMVSDAVVQRVKDKFDFRRIDRVAVKGKAQATFVYELLGAAGAPRALAVERYEAALDAYFRREFEGAFALLDHDDGPCRTLKARCAELKAKPPPKEWDGVWTLHTK